MIKLEGKNMTGFPGIVRHHFRLYDPASWLSLIIRICTWSDWNHCIIFLFENGVLYVVEAQAKGITKLTFDDWRKHRRYKSWKVGVPYSPVPEDMPARIRSRIGRRYDYESLLIWHPIRIFIARWFGGKSSKGKLTCSEFVGLCWAEYFPTTWYHLTTEDIVRSGKFNFDDKSFDPIVQLLNKNAK